MDLGELEKKIYALNDRSMWLSLHEQVLKNHEIVRSEVDKEKLLDLHKVLLDKVEKWLPDSIDLDKFRELRLQEYNKMLLSEATIGGSLCVETLYELTQRELQAGRMLPTHELIETAIQATAAEHYSRDQLVRQKEKIQSLQEHSVLNKLSRLFK